MQNFIIGLGIGIAVAIVTLIAMAVNNHKKLLEKQTETDKLKNMLNDRMDLENEGIQKLKKENETLKKQNENLRITVATYSQKPGRKEISRLHVYQLAADRLMLNSPGFGAAWQASLKESEDEFQKTYIGIQPFIRKIIPLKTDATVINQIPEDPNGN
ncbi:MAG: hypothetical protein LKE40_04260 [Spirochaetia bacterium]|jgi:predicted small secreted protein|nr:hypothetical protein [Spirochaetia bacterium]